ncbi:response regulator [Sphingomonas sp.]|uniref:response regulator n=1 Tax=Sphingomonas sp. TaxID=28214 RepID=UPI0025CC725C|nr:response regulator [Sphingomonas sp.]
MNVVFRRRRSGAESLRLLLAARGYDVDLYAGGEALLEAKLDSRARTCLIVDYLMPDIDGLTLLGRLRTQGWSESALLITGHFNATLEARALAVGFSRVFEKPLDHERLLDSVALLKASL